MIDVCGLIELFWILLSIRVVLGTLVYEYGRYCTRISGTLRCWKCFDCTTKVAYLTQCVPRCSA